MGTVKSIRWPNGSIGITEIREAITFLMNDLILYWEEQKRIADLYEGDIVILVSGEEVNKKLWLAEVERHIQQAKDFLK